MIYQIKSWSILEFLAEIFIAINIPWGLAILFLFKRSDKLEQRVAIPPDRLVWAKLWMLVTGGLWWFWWRYWEDRCEHCGCVWCQDPIEEQELDRYTEPYTVSQRIQIKKNSDPASHHSMTMPVTLYRDIVVKETVYRCVNCGHEHTAISRTRAAVPRRFF